MYYFLNRFKRNNQTHKMLGSTSILSVEIKQKPFVTPALLVCGVDNESCDIKTKVVHKVEKAYVFKNIITYEEREGAWCWGISRKFFTEDNKPPTGALVSGDKAS